MLNGSFRMTLACLLLAAASARAETSRTNFVFILADDLGVRDLSAQGSTFYLSPNIDRIVNEGMRFTQGYASCQVCSPSRASIMTGKCTPRHGITDYIGAPAGAKWKRNTKLLPTQYATHLAHNDTTLAEALRAAGYRTFFAGKWHLGGHGSLPDDHGFEVNMGGWDRGSPAGGFFSPYKNPLLKDGPAGESLPVRLGEETARFIEAHQGEPFLAYLSFYSVHAPIQTTRQLWSKYRQKATAGADVRTRFLIDRTLPVRQVQDNPIYAGMIESMDRAVGIVLDKLDTLGLSDNTVVVFTSDNGGVSSGDAYSTSNLPYRGGKGRQWEGGIREPYYVRAPGVTSPGSRCDVPVTGTDFYPTILELAGLPPRPEQHVDGVSLVPLLRGDSIAIRDLFWHYPHYGNQGGEPSSIIRSRDWKLIHYWEDGRDELYNLAQDVQERSEMAGKHPDIRASLRQKLDRWLEETGARLPSLNPHYDAQQAERQRSDVRSKLLPGLEKRHAAYLDPDWTPNKTWWDSTLHPQTVD
ncbi:MAG: sulfatase [Pirellulales bacterium]